MFFFPSRIRIKLNATDLKEQQFVRETDLYGIGFILILLLKKKIGRKLLVKFITSCRPYPFSHEIMNQINLKHNNWPIFPERTILPRSASFHL